MKSDTGEDAVDSSLTLAALCGRFLASRAGEAPSTQYLYRVTCDLYLRPILGHVRAVDLRPSHIEALRNQLRIAQPPPVVETRVARVLAKWPLPGAQRTAVERTTRTRFVGQPVGVRTVRKVLAVLVSVLNYGVDEGVIRSNVAARVKKPTLCLVDPQTGETSEERRITEHEILQTADFARVDVQVPERYRLLVRLAFLIGARQGELLGLQWPLSTERRHPYGSSAVGVTDASRR